MNFSAREMKHIKSLQKQERQWPRTRWMYLAVGLLAVAGFVLNGYVLWELFKEGEATAWPSDSVLVFAILWPGLLIKLAIAVYFPLQALTQWHGDPTRALLLRLLGDEQHEEHGAGAR